jgi:hypothetical protein
VIIEADAHQSGLHLDGVPRSMPHVGHLEPGQQLKRRRPIGDRIARDAGPLVPLGPMLQASTPIRRSATAAARPPIPAPMITTRIRLTLTRQPT